MFAMTQKLKMLAVTLSQSAGSPPDPVLTRFGTIGTCTALLDIEYKCFNKGLLLHTGFWEVVVASGCGCLINQAPSPS